MSVVLCCISVFMRLVLTLYLGLSPTALLTQKFEQFLSGCHQNQRMTLRQWMNVMNNTTATMTLSSSWIKISDSVLEIPTPVLHTCHGKYWDTKHPLVISNFETHICKMCANFVHSASSCWAEVRGAWLKISINVHIFCHEAPIPDVQSFTLGHVWQNPISKTKPVQCPAATL